MQRSFVLCGKNVCIIQFRLIKAHEESREKKYEYELSWICEESNHVHKMVNEKLISEAVEKALAAIDEE